MSWPLGPCAAGVRVAVEQRYELRSRQRAPPVLVEVGQDRIEPAPDVAAMNSFSRAQRAHQRVLHQVVGNIGIARQRLRIAAQCGDHGFEHFDETRSWIPFTLVRRGRLTQHNTQTR